MKSIKNKLKTNFLLIIMLCSGVIFSQPQDFTYSFPGTTSGTPNFTTGANVISLSTGGNLTTSIAFAGQPLNTLLPNLFFNFDYTYTIYLTPYTGTGTTFSASTSIPIATHTVTGGDITGNNGNNIPNWNIYYDNSLGLVSNTTACTLTINDAITSCLASGHYQVDVVFNSYDMNCSSVTFIELDWMGNNAITGSAEPVIAENTVGNNPVSLTSIPLPYGTGSAILSQMAFVNITATPSPITLSLPGTIRTCGTSGTASATVTATPTVSCSTTPTYTYAWSTTPVQTTATATGLTAGTYHVTVTSSTGATASATTTITSTGSALSTTATASSLSICSGHTTNISATATGGTSPYQYLWSTGNTTLGPITVTPTNVSNPYTITVTDQGGCTATSTVTVSVSAIVGIRPATICSGSSTTLTPLTGGSGTYTYSWSDAGHSTTPSITVSPATTTTYTLTVTNNGCTATASAVVTVKTTPTVTPTSISWRIGYPQTTTLTATGGTGASYAWSTGGTGSSITATYGGGPGATSYTVTVTGPNTCSAVLTIPVNYYHMASASGPEGISTTDNDLNSLNVYPNPVDDIVNFDYSTEKGENFSLRIIDLSGREVLVPVSNMYKDNGQKTLSINLGSLSKGIYCYELIGEKTYIGKLIKQ